MGTGNKFWYARGCQGSQADIQFPFLAVGFHRKQTLEEISGQGVCWGSTCVREEKIAGLRQGRSWNMMQSHKGFSQTVSSRTGMAP